MTSSKEYGVWDLVLVSYPFTDLALTKKRPGLVVQQFSSAQFGSMVLVAMITSNVESEELVGDLLIKDWESAGLLMPSRLRLSFLATLKSELIVRRLGSLSPRDRNQGHKAFRESFKILLAPSGKT